MCDRVRVEQKISGTATRVRNLETFPKKFLNKNQFGVIQLRLATVREHYLSFA